LRPIKKRSNSSRQIRYETDQITQSNVSTSHGNFKARRFFKSHMEQVTKDENAL